jgi:D-alanine-D-alanine ligase
MTGGIMEKLRIGLLFGGRSVEHDVSIVSATSILGALDRERYDVSLIGIDPEGGWHLADVADLAPGASLASVLEGPGVYLAATRGAASLRPVDQAAAGALDPSSLQVDVVFPIVHGRGGEDGALQGLLESADLPYVGSGVLSSAAQMDKDVAKRLLAHAGIPVTPWVTFSAAELDRDGLPAAADRVETELGLPAYVKPANSGSSVGISRAEDTATLVAAIAEARRYDRKVVVEQAVTAREVEVAVLGNDAPEASVVGEIRAAQAFYDYDAKYRDDSTELLIPAELDAELADSIRHLAVLAYQALDAEGMARVDFLLERETHRIYVNELNSLPGFTHVSMYPKLWEATGLAYPRLLDRLIQLALERHDGRAKLETHAPPPLAERGD